MSSREIINISSITVFWYLLGNSLIDTFVWKACIFDKNNIIAIICYVFEQKYSFNLFNVLISEFKL